MELFSLSLMLVGIMVSMAGCPCCDSDYEPCCGCTDESAAAGYEVTFAGIADGTCDACDDFYNDTFLMDDYSEYLVTVPDPVTHCGANTIYVCEWRGAVTIEGFCENSCDVLGGNAINLLFLLCTIDNGDGTFSCIPKFFIGHVCMLNVVYQGDSFTSQSCASFDLDLTEQHGECTGWPASITITAV